MAQARGGALGYRVRWEGSHCRRFSIGRHFLMVAQDQDLSRQTYHILRWWVEFAVRRVDNLRTPEATVLLSPLHH